MKHLKKILAISLMMLTLFMMALPAMAASGYSPGDNYEAHNNGGTGGVWCYNSSTLDTGGRCGTINTGTKLRIKSQVGNAYKIDVLGNVNSNWVGSTVDKWIHVDYARPVSGGGTNPGTGIGSGLELNTTTFINATYVNVRSGPGTNYSAVAQTASTIVPYQYVLVTGVSSPVSGYIWYQVSGSFNGWIRGDYLYGTN